MSKKIKGKKVYETEWGGFINMEPRDGKCVSIKVSAKLTAWWVKTEEIVLVDDDVVFQIGTMTEDGKWKPAILAFGPYISIAIEFFSGATVLPHAERASGLGIAVDAAVEMAEAWSEKLRGLVSRSELHTRLEAARKEKEHEAEGSKS